MSRGTAGKTGPWILVVAPHREDWLPAKEEEEMDAQHSPRDAAAGLAGWCSLVEGAPLAMAVTIGAETGCTA